MSATAAREAWITITISSRVNASGVQYLPNVQVNVLSGGEISYDLIQAAFVTIEVGGSAVDNTVTDYTGKTVYGSEFLTTIADGGQVVIESTGHGGRLYVQAGGVLQVDGDDLADPATTSSGVASNTLVFGNGSMTVLENGLATYTNLEGGELDVENGSAAFTLVAVGHQT